MLGSGSSVRSRAPFRLGIGGGGTDVSPYCDDFGGAVLNATINLYAHVFLTPIQGQKIQFVSLDLEVSRTFSFRELDDSAEVAKELQLHIGVYRYIRDHFNQGKNMALRIVTDADVPKGSGLGSSSTIVVALVEAFRTLLNIPLGEYELAQVAHRIERVECGLEGGKQDQYAATFGGFNFIEFNPSGSVVVNPLRVRRFIQSELEARILLYFTGVSRDSATIISDQSSMLEKPDHEVRLKAMHNLKSSAYKMKDLLLKSEIAKLGSELRAGWREKKVTSASISNATIEQCESFLEEYGVDGYKISGAGGGGFMMIFVDPEKKRDLRRRLGEKGGSFFDFKFTQEGATSWTI